MARVVNLWNTRAKNPETIEWCLGIDAGNSACLDVAKALAEENLNVKIAVNNGPKTCVAGWNASAEVSTGKVLIAVADDFVPPNNWDELLLSLKPVNWIDGEYVVKVEDGYVHNIFVLSILTRKRYERFGYLFYPKYPSMFNDTEFGEVAVRDGVVIDANHLLFEHLHPDCGKRPRDGHDLIHASQERWNTGEMLFNFRRAAGFPLDDGPKAVKSEASTKNNKNDKYVAYLQVTKDDLCLLDVCQRLVEEGVNDFCFCQPDKYWSGEPVEQENVDDVQKAVKALKDAGQTVHYSKYNVDSYTTEGSSRIDVETRLRNASLDWIRSLGYEHILIVDGDELWMRGTLKVIKAYVEQGRQSVSVRMIPVIGLPGFPVDGATDTAVVYIGSGMRFKACRSPFTPPTVVFRPMIYHFTGTRRNMEETVKKHRRGGHYDDPDYDFEGWIKDKLPNIKPGMQNAHMFTKWQVWPKVRAWKENELAEMPASVRPYLGTTKN
jgi:hypothetical protein